MSAREQKHNYQDKLQKFIAAGNIPASGLSQVNVSHDNWCKVYDGGYCNCDPSISLKPNIEFSKQSQTPINLADFINPKCNDCYGNGLVRRRVEFKRGDWRSAILMCDCVEKTVAKMAKADPTIQPKHLLAQILEALKHREAQKAN